MSKNILVSAGVALLVVVLGFAFLDQPSIVKEIVKEKLGAFPGNEFMSNEITYNGITYHYRQVPFQTSTSTVCNIEVPNTRASTTLISAGATIFGSPTTTHSLNIWTGVGQNVTTTILAGARVLANSTGTAVMATTSLTGADVIMGTGDEFIVFDWGEGGNYVAVEGQTGRCSAVWKEY